jgi:hypothetical protein
MLSVASQCGLDAGEEPTLAQSMTAPYKAEARVLGITERTCSWVLLAVVLIGGLLLRLDRLGEMPLWADEAESAINALTVLRDGVPTRDYLGIPTFENTLIERSPQSPEYEFTDISYSPDGLAIYHGWLPLYAIAASFRLFGITPDPPGGPLVARHDSDARWERTVAARLPSVFFGMITLVLLFCAGSDLFGRRAGLIAAGLGAFTNSIIFLQQQARYYSAAVMIGLLAGWLVWRMLRRGNWGDYALAGFALTALFYTHVVSFIAMCLIASAGALATQRPRKYSKFAVHVAILLVCCGSWLLLTGYFRHLAHVPMAWQLFSPRDILSAVASVHTLLLAVCAAVIAVLEWRSRYRFVHRLHENLRPFLPAFLFVSKWLVIGYAMFVLCIPAPSLFSHRLTAIVLAPALLLCGALIAFALRLLPDDKQFALGLLFMLIVTVLSNKLRPGPTDADVALARGNVEAAVDYLSARLEPETKLYATPSQHLVLTFYTGLPVQSIAPIRRTFLNSYPGPIVFFERDDFAPRSHDPASLDGVIAAARRAGYRVSRDEAREISWQVAWARPRLRLQGRVSAIEPAAMPLPPFAAALERMQSAAVNAREAQWEAYHRDHPLFRGIPIRTAHDVWTVHFYRFVDPASRRQNLPYAERLMKSTASLLRADWIVYRSPGFESQGVPH